MMATNAALAKPVRVIRELSSTEQFIRATERAMQIRDAGRARLDAEYVERIEDARIRYLLPPGDAASSEESAPEPVTS